MANKSIQTNHFFLLDEKLRKLDKIVMWSRLYNVMALCKVLACLAVSALAFTIPYFNNTAFMHQVSHFTWPCIYAPDTINCLRILYFSTMEGERGKKKQFYLVHRQLGLTTENTEALKKRRLIQGIRADLKLPFTFVLSLQ